MSVCMRVAPPSKEQKKMISQWCQSFFLLLRIDVPLGSMVTLSNLQPEQEDATTCPNSCHATTTNLKGNNTCLIMNKFQQTRIITKNNAIATIKKKRKKKYVNILREKES